MSDFTKDSFFGRVNQNLVISLLASLKKRRKLYYTNQRNFSSEHLCQIGILRFTSFTFQFKLIVRLIFLFLLSRFTFLTTILTVTYIFISIFCTSTSLLTLFAFLCTLIYGRPRPKMSNDCVIRKTSIYAKSLYYCDFFLFLFCAEEEYKYEIELIQAVTVVVTN